MASIKVSYSIGKPERQPMPRYTSKPSCGPSIVSRFVGDRFQKIRSLLVTLRAIQEAAYQVELLGVLSHKEERIDLLTGDLGERARAKSDANRRYESSKKLTACILKTPRKESALLDNKSYVSRGKCDFRRPKQKCSKQVLFAAREGLAQV